MRLLALLLVLISVTPAFPAGPELLLALLRPNTQYATTTFDDGTAQGWTLGSGGIVTDYAYSAPYAYRSDYVYPSVVDSISKTATCANGYASFWFKYETSDVSPRAYVNTVQKTLTAGAVSGAWTQYSFPVTAGSNIIRIDFVGTGSGSRGWVDDIKIPVAPQYADPFTGTDNTTLATHDANWVSMDASHVVGNLALYGNTARLASAWAIGGAVYNTSSSDVSQITMQPVSAEIFKRVCVRAGGANGTGYCIYLNTKSGSNWTRLSLKKDGVFIKSVTVAAPMSAAYSLRIDASGTSPVLINGYMDGTSVLFHSDSTSPLVGGHPGFCVEGNGTLTDSAVGNWSDYAN